MKAFKRGAAIFVAVAFSLSPSAEGPARADDSGEMQIRKGVELRRRGRDAEAANFFRQAYDVSHTPRAAAQLGLCEQSLARWLEAEQHLSEALAAESDPWIASKRSTLHSSRQEVRKRLGSIRVSGTPEGATVTLDDRMIGQLPLTEDAWALPGSHILVARKDGFETFTSTFDLAIGDARTVEVKLKEPLLLVGAPPLGRGTTLGVSQVTSEPKPVPEVNHGWRTPAMWGAFGLGAASLTFGVVSHVGRERDARSFNDEKGGCFKESGQILGGAGCESLDREIAARTSQMVVGYVGAVIFVGAGAYLYATRPRVWAKVACTLSPVGSNLLGCSGRF